MILEKNLPRNRKKKKNLQLEDLTQFYNQEIKPISYNVAIMGKKKKI